MEEERRYLPLGIKVEKREDGKVKIAGYAAKFGKMSEDLGGFREKIAPGAFKRSLKRSDPRALFNHDRNFVLGRKSAGTLKLTEDDTGLFIEIDPPDTQVARDLMVSIRRGDINQQSFGFTVAKDSWEGLDEGKTPTRTLEEVGQLFDVSPVTFPAYPDTQVALRSLNTAKSGVETDPEDKPNVFTLVETDADVEPKPVEVRDETVAEITTAVNDKEIPNRNFWGTLKE